MADITYNEDKEEEIYLSETAKIIIAHIKMRQTGNKKRNTRGVSRRNSRSAKCSKR